MTNRKSLVACVVISVFIIPAMLFAMGDPFTGHWKLNLSQSTIPSPVPKTQTVHIKANAKGIEIREEIVYDKGEPTEVSVKARFDGKDYAVQGSPFADAVVYDRIDNYTIKGIAKKAGKVVSHETAIISQDGKTMTVTYNTTDPLGKTITAVAVFDKQ